MWSVPVKGTELTDCKWVSSVCWWRSNKTQQLIFSTLFYQFALSLIWRVSSDKQEFSFAIAAYSEEHTNKKTALVTVVFLRHECWPTTLIIWSAIAAFRCSQVVSGLILRYWKSHQVMLKKGPLLKYSITIYASKSTSNQQDQLSWMSILSGCPNSKPKLIRFYERLIIQNL